jgi:uroporphyrinogen-III decarboxylase
MHSCGSVWALLDDFISAGFDIINPVQCSAAHMNPFDLKRNSGAGSLSGEAAWTPKAPFPSARRRRSAQEVCERIRAFGPGGGFVFNAVHNIQALVPVENVLTMYRTAREYGRYPLRLESAA